MMVDDIAAARFSRAKLPHLTSPKDTLAAFMRDIASGEINPDKLIIVYATAPDEDHRVSVGWYQGGPVSLAESAGLLNRAAWLMNTDPD